MESQKKQEGVKMRKVVIMTDGINIKMDREEIPSNLELQAILETILRKITIK